MSMFRHAGALTAECKRGLEGNQLGSRQGANQSLRLLRSSDDSPQAISKKRSCAAWVPSFTSSVPGQPCTCESR